MNRRKIAALLIPVLLCLAGCGATASSTSGKITLSCVVPFNRDLTLRKKQHTRQGVLPFVL